jgi:hypothetical protein
LHVKIATEDAPRHEQYMENIVEAWKSATEVYCEVFDQLTRITAAEPSEGREAGHAHEQFMGMLNTVQKARDIAKDYALATSNAQAAANAATGESEDAGGEDSGLATDSKPESKTTKTTKSAPSNGKAAKRMFAEVDAPTTQPANPRKMSRAERRQSWKSKDTNEATEQTEDKQGDKEAGATITPAPVPTDTSKSQPAVEYEDVSNLVEARLKAKAERSAAKKKSTMSVEKKRKRDSGDSFMAAAAEEEKNPKPVQTEAAVAKPKRKKSKTATDGVLNGDGDSSQTKQKSGHIPKDQPAAPKEKVEKRKTAAEEVEESVKPTGKKRKKNKGQ